MENVINKKKKRSHYSNPLRNAKKRLKGFLIVLFISYKFVKGFLAVIFFITYYFELKLS